MINWKCTKKDGTRVEGAGNFTFEFDMGVGEIRIDGDHQRIYLPKVSEVVIQVPSDDPTRPVTVATVYTDNLILSGVCAVYCASLPEGVRFGASRDWPSNSGIPRGFVVTAEYDPENMKLTGNALVISLTDLGSKMDAGEFHIIYNNWNDFEKEYRQQLEEDQWNDSSDLYDLIAENGVDPE